jgi:hypothetical protein
VKSLFPTPVPPERRRAARPASGIAPKPTKKRPTGPRQAKAADVPGNIVVVMLLTEKWEEEGDGHETGRDVRNPGAHCSGARRGDDSPR